MRIHLEDDVEDDVKDDVEDDDENDVEEDQHQVSNEDPPLHIHVVVGVFNKLYQYIAIDKY